MDKGDTDRRLASLEHLSPEDWERYLSELLSKSEDDRRTAYQLRISYDLVNALHRMDRTGTALTKRLIVLTWVLVILTAILLVEPALKLWDFFVRF